MARIKAVPITEMPDLSEEDEAKSLVRDPYLVAMGEKITAARKLRGMNRLQLAEAADVTPVSTNLIEVGMRNASINTLRKIAEALHTVPSALMPDHADGETATGALFVAPDLTEPIRIYKEIVKLLRLLEDLVERAEQVQGRVEMSRVPLVDERPSKKPNSPKARKPPP